MYNISAKTNFAISKRNDSFVACISEMEGKVYHVKDKHLQQKYSEDSSFLKTSTLLPVKRLGQHGPENLKENCLGNFSTGYLKMT
jgi:hypothetical protein